MAKIKKITRIKNLYNNGMAVRRVHPKVYDIEIEDNHNYLANGLLVSNSGSTSYTELLEGISHVYYRYGFSGSFLRNDSKTLDMWGILSNVLYEYPAKKAIADGYITPVEFRMISMEGIPKRVYHKEYEENYCGSTAILLEIKRILSKIRKGKQVLILVKQKSKSGDIIHKFLKKNGIENSYISGDDKKEKISDTIKRFNEKKINILVGSKVIGEGIDINSTEELILATGGKSEIEIIQAVGRAVRLSEGKDKAIVYDFDFEDTKFLTKHTQERIRIYKEQFDGKIFYE
jgi:superfamily II DNA or RNA helicase